MKNILMVLALIFYSLVQINAQDLVINEFMSNNETTIQDEDGDYSDWIELYNKGNDPINLKDFSISDDESEPNKWIFPEIIIAADSFLLIWASNKDLLNINELHTNFKLKKSGEELLLSNPLGEVIDSIGPISLQADYSYGLLPYGNDQYTIFMAPTPNKANGHSSSINSSHPSGFYSSEIQLALTPTNGNPEIHYTLNGKTPTVESPLYISSLPISNNTSSPNNFSAIPTTPSDGPAHLADFIWSEPSNVYKANVIRYAGFEDSSRISPIYSKTFFIDSTINSRYTFPILSIITDSLNLFDYDTGIYIPGKRFDDEGWGWAPAGNYLNRGIDWERDAHVSYFEPDGPLAFETDAGMKMYGFGSTMYPQKSFALYFRNEYGLHHIDYPIFKNMNNNQYKRLVFRNSGQDFLASHFRDALLQDLLSPLDLETQNFQPSTVFINGEYWGIFVIRQKYNKHYFKYNLGIQEENINILGTCGEVIEGSNIEYNALIEFIEANDLAIENNYSYVSEKVDIQNYIDYQIVEIYYANYDWPCNNSKMWKTNDSSSKWRYLIYDLDMSFGTYNSPYNKTSFHHATSTNNNWPHCECSNLLFRKLLENNNFKEQFTNRFAYHLNTTFNYQTILNKIDEFQTLFAPEMEEHIERWTYPNNIDEWEAEIDVLKDFAKKRPCYIKEHIMDFFNLTTFDFLCFTPTSNLNKERGLTISKNPSDGEFSITNNSVNIPNATIRIISTNGTIIYQKDEISLPKDESVHFELSHLPNQTYFLQIISDEYIIQKKLIVIN